MRWGDDADEGPQKDQSWINVAPGMAVEIEYSSAEYQCADNEDEIGAKLTGRVRITREKIFAADFLIDSLTGKEKD